MIAMVRFLTFLMLLVMPSLTAADIKTAISVGSAFETGVSKELTRKRAIADALENFMLQHGAKFSSLTLVEDGIIKLDQLKVSSENQVLGFDVINEQNLGDKISITLKILFGDFKQQAKCLNPHQLRFSDPQISLKQVNMVPPYLSNLSMELRDEIKAVAARHKNLTFVKSGVRSVSRANSNLTDYVSIVAAQVKGQLDGGEAPQENNEHNLKVTIDLHYSKGSEVVTARFWPTSDNNALNRHLRNIETRAQSYRIGLILPFKKVPRNRSKMIDELLGPFLVSLEQSFELAACSPKSSKLRKSGKLYYVNLGSNHGVRDSSIFLLQNGQPTGFIVKELGDKQSSLQALQGTVTQSNFDGEIVYLLQ